MIFNYLSGMREDCGDISINEVLDFAMRAAGKCMNGKRAEMLRIIAARGGQKTITSVVDEISLALSCPKSTVWANLNLLKELGLVENGRGRPVKVTNLGGMVLGKFLAEAARAGNAGKKSKSQGAILIYSDAEEDLVPV